MWTLCGPVGTRQGAPTAGFRSGVAPEYQPVRVLVSALRERSVQFELTTECEPVKHYVLQLALLDDVGRET